MNRQMQIIRAVAIEADAFHGRSEEFGTRAAKSIAGERGRAQLSGLENIANAALTVASVLDYVKRQTARHKEWQRDRFGPDLLTFLTDSLRQHRDTIAHGLDPTSEAEQQRIHLLLIREFVRQLAVHYEFARSQ